MAKQHILVVEDEEDIRELVRYHLEREGYRITGVATGEEGLRIARERRPDLLILDLMLPGIDGLDVCRSIRSDPELSRMHVVMLTAKGEEPDIVAGLELGADDYITKPFRPRVLVARVKAVLRRARGEEANAGERVIERDGLTIHPGRHEVRVSGEPVELTVTEFRILHMLAKRPGWVFTRYQIVDSVRGEEHPVSDRSVDVQIVGLRKKLGAAANLIETVRGVGYRFRESR
ncbi:MAG: Phosphate regulon transcriptional regulatory protein PhoB [Calditrichaeota bacterium]|nr:Phosphate regulon transcriptional regulatory protein PhoB [Calditrichota bacterium]